MAQDNFHGAAREAKEDGSSIQGAVPEQTAQSSSALSEENHSPQDDARDLEELAIVSTGPVYSVFGRIQKRYIVLMVSSQSSTYFLEILIRGFGLQVTWAAFISPTSANIYFPALNPLEVDLRVSPTSINLTLTSYMIFQGLAPTVFGDLAEMAGRRPAYIIAFTIYLGANIGLALQDSYAALFILPCLQSTGSSGQLLWVLASLQIFRPARS